jgi:hypothetical protein
LLIMLQNQLKTPIREDKKLPYVDFVKSIVGMKSMIYHTSMQEVHSDDQSWEIFWNH